VSVMVGEGVRLGVWVAVGGTGVKVEVEAGVKVSVFVRTGAKGERASVEESLLVQAASPEMQIIKNTSQRNVVFVCISIQAAACTSKSIMMVAADNLAARILQ
jgi:hypothetical protein